jgi:hypothetical protein
VELSVNITMKYLRHKSEKEELTQIHLAIISIRSNMEYCHMQERELDLTEC